MFATVMETGVQSSPWVPAVEAGRDDDDDPVWAEARALGTTLLLWAEKYLLCMRTGDVVRIGA